MHRHMLLLPASFNSIEFSLHRFDEVKPSSPSNLRLISFSFTFTMLKESRVQGFCETYVEYSSIERAQDITTGRSRNLLSSTHVKFDPLLRRRHQLANVHNSISAVPSVLCNPRVSSFIIWFIADLLTLEAAPVPLTHQSGCPTPPHSPSRLSNTSFNKVSIVERRLRV